MFRKISLCILAIPLLVLAISLPTNAAGFDPAYYGARYPDVVAVYGDSSEALYDHYVHFGKREGRFQNAEEEAASASSATVQASAPASGYSTYVDVDIAAQTVTYYVDGQAVFQSPCVSGNVSANNDTPKGTFKIVTHTNGKYLKGPTWNCWVDYWMRFSGTNCGLHDATWRSQFGGSIYQTNGSHGCVNMPHEAAQSLFNMIGIGTIVVVH